jgi:hypothetical protein
MKRNTEIKVEKHAADVVADRTTFCGIDAADLSQHQNAEPDWLVEGVFSADQPTVFGAASKATKTTQLIDLAVALATSTKWLGHFIVPRARKTLLITGESNYRACSKRVQRALKARGLEWSDIAGKLRIEAIDFPALQDPEHRQQISKGVAEHGIEVVIIDPLYRGLAGLDTHRMAEVGSAIVSFTQAVRPAGLITSHHVTKTSARDLSAPPSLEDLSGAGLAESCGNWWLIGRNEPYKFNRMHDLIVQFGGRDEQAGLMRIVFNEANWTFQVTHGENLKQQREAEAEKRRIQIKEAKINNAMSAIKKCLANEQIPRPKSWLEDRSGESQAVTRKAIADLLTHKVIEERDYKDTRNVTQSGLILCQSR